MQDKKLTDQEYLAIDSILEDAERKYLPKNSVTFDLETLDKQCRDIWSDWDFSVPAFSRSPESIKEKTNNTTVYQSTQAQNLNIDHSNSDDESNESNSEDIKRISRNSPSKFTTNIKNTQNLNVSDSDSDSKEYSEEISTESEVIKKPSKSPMRSPLSFSGKYSAAKSKNKSHKKSPFKSTSNATNKSISGKSSLSSKKQVNAYERADVARLRQDNISLRSMVARLQDALDRANFENSRLKEELNKSEMTCMRQKGIISYLKEQKLYGKK